MNILDLQPGIYPDIPNQMYHSLDQYVSNSYLGRLAQVPAAAKVPSKTTAPMTFGSAAHAYILEGEIAFLAAFAIAFQCDRRTKDGKAAYAAFEADNAGRTVIDRSDYDTILGMDAAIKAHPFARKIVRQGVSETTVIWQDKESGIMCKCRPDRIPSGNRGVLVDLKTTDDASERGFTRSILKYGYARQAAFYLDGVNAVSEQTHDIFCFIAVEKKPPYRVEVYTLSPEFVQYGRTEYQRLLDIELQCREAKQYPHYISELPVELSLPGYL